MITRDLIKSEIDKVPDEELPALYRIVKALEQPAEPMASASTGVEEWKVFLRETYGSTAPAPIERGAQGRSEVREPLE